MSNRGTRLDLLQRVSKVAKEVVMMVTRMPVTSDCMGDTFLTLSGSRLL